MAGDNQENPEGGEPPQDGAAAIAWAILKAGRAIGEAIDRLAEATHRLADAQL